MKYKLQDIIDIQEFQSLQECLNKILPFAVSIVDHEGNLLTSSGWQEICTKFHNQNPQSAEKCRQSKQKMVNRLKETNPKNCYQCPLGLIDCAIPIMIEGEYYGSFFTGQLFIKPPDLDFFRQQAREFGFDEAEYIRAVEKVPIWTQERLDNFLQYTTQLINLLLENGLEKYKEREKQKRSRKNEQKLRSLLEASTQPVFTIDRNGTCLYMNSAATAYLGGNEEDLTGKTLKDFCSPGVADKQMKYALQALDNGQILEITHETMIGGKTHWFNCQLQPIQNEAGEYEHLQVYMVDITERKLAEDAIKQGHDYFLDIFQTVTDGIIYASGPGEILAVNRAMTDILDIPEEAFIGENILAFARQHLSPQVLKKALPQIVKMLKGKEIGPFEVNFKGKNLEIRSHTNPTTGRFTAVAHDISAHKKAEAERQLMEDRFSSAFHTSPDAININRLSDGKYVEVNRVFTNITGYSEEEIVGKTSADLNFWAKPEDFARFFHEMKEHGKVSNLETQFKVKDGQLLSSLVSASFIEINGETCIFSITRDISKRVETERMLKESEARFKAVSEHAHNAICLVDEAGKIIWVNEAFVRIGGYSREQAYAVESFLQFLAPESFEFVYENFQKFLKKEPYIDHYSFYAFRADGQKRLFETHVADYKDRQGKRIQAISLVDVTERVQAEEALKKSHDYFQDIFNTVKDGIIYTDLSGEILALNRAMLDILGASKEKFIGKNLRLILQELLTPQAAQKVVSLVENISRGKEIKTFEFEFQDKVLEAYANINHTTQRFTGVIRDITARKKIEAERQMLEDRFTKAFHTSPDAITISSLKDSHFIEVNQVFCELLGYTVEETIGKSALEMGIWVDPEVRNELQRLLLQHGEVMNYEAQACTKDGRILTCLMSATTIKIDAKDCLLLITRDITHRKREEMELRQSEERYQTFIQQSSEGIYRMEIEPPLDVSTPIEEQIDYLYEHTAIAECNLTFAKMYNASSVEALIGKRLLDLHTTKDNPLNRSELRSLIAANYLVVDTLTQEKTFDGKDVFFSNNTIGVVENGKLVRMWGTQLDVTERRKAEEALRASEVRLRAVLGGAPLLLFVVTPEKLVTFAEGRNLTDHPGSANALAGLYAADFFTDSGILLEGINLALKGEEYDMEWQAGDERWLSAHLSPFRDEKNLISGAIGVILDISERRQMEKIVEDSQKMADIGTLSAAVMHEIKSPLQVITGISESLARQLKEGNPVDRERISRQMDMINRNSWRITQTATSLLNYARASGENAGLYNLNEIVEDTLLLMDHYLTTWSNIEIITDLEKDLPPLLCERNKISQVLINLLTNARDAMMECNGTISIRSGQKGKKQFLRVSDSGTGIPYEIQEKIFLPFYTTKPSGKGTGLGLSIVADIVREQGGQIELKSNPGQGSEFTVWFASSF